MKPGHSLLVVSRRKFLCLVATALAVPAVPVLAAGQTSVLSGRWRAEAIRNHGIPPELKSILEIAADGKVTGSGGCNRISGKATVTGAHMTFGPIVSTKMACAPAIMDQESHFLSALADTRLWRIDETRDKLILVDAHGKTVLRLAKM